MQTCKLAISSMSLGRCWAGHSLAYKLDMARKYGYQAIELFHEDLADVADRFFSDTSASESQPSEPSQVSQLAAAEHIYEMCRTRGIQILCLQPFMHYDGLIDRAEHAAKLKKLDVWIGLARALHTDIIQVPSNFLPPEQVSGDLDLIAADLQELADIGLRVSPPIRFVYEALCWGTRVDVWERCWEVVKRVDRPNFGMCLDSFNIAGRVYADPASPTGRTPNAEGALKESMARLVAEVDMQKVFYVQIVDAERLSEPLVKGHAFYNPDEPKRMSWSRNCRLFYGEKERGAYLPIRDVAAAFFHGIGYRGWVSLELFNRRMSEEGADVPEELARRGAISWNKLTRDLKLPVDSLSKL
jgi:4-hydroxyphenylpyruvate dioxygenase